MTETFTMPSPNVPTKIGLAALSIAGIGAAGVLLGLLATRPDEGGASEFGSIDRDLILTTYEKARIDPAARRALLDPRNIVVNDVFLQRFHVFVCTPHDQTVLTTGNAGQSNPLAERTIDPDLDIELCRFTPHNLNGDLLKGTSR